MHSHHTATGYDPREGLALLNHSLERTLDQNRSLLEEMARFTKDESLRLAHAQLDRTGTAFTHLHAHRDFGGLIGAQQEWVKQVMQDYAGFTLRAAEMFHTLTLQVQSHVQGAASDFRHQTEAAMEDLDPDLSGMTGAQGRNGEHTHLPAE